ncbi:hypothetical protein [Tepidicella baoligensis]|uniref:hypothetical protein n=1 Tax=Tepidicella baoligensis TaxID=2707016 RepID=UPI0015D9E5C4|nr:hypothetical protein [Tepidicella baoligensis]
MREIRSFPVGKVALVGWALCAIMASAAPLEFEDIALEGQLRFLAQRPDPDAYRYEASAVIDLQSLQTGVVTLRTCHLQLDPNRRVVVTFNRERVQHIEILETAGVGRAWVDGHRVELADVQRGGRVCIGLRSQALESTGDGRWRLHAGPLMRRYLDGYLPMEAKLSLQWPAGLLTVEQTRPAPQPGVRLSETADGATLDMTFAGRMSATWELKSPGR